MVIRSDYDDKELPNENLWNGLYPCLKKYEKLTAFVQSSNDDQFTFGELMQRSLRWAKELQKHFVESKPPTVFTMVSNCIEYPPLAIGSFAVGAVFCPISSDMTHDVALTILRQVQPDILVTEDYLLPKVKKIISNLEIKPKVYARGPSPDSLKDICKILYHGEAMDEKHAGQYDPSSISVICYTSGTTGIPKGIVFTSKNYLDASRCYSDSPYFLLNYSTDATDQHTVVGSLPFAHSFGLQNFCIVNVLHGSKFIYIDSLDEAYVSNSINKYKPQFIYLRPYMLESFCKMDDLSFLDSIQFIFITGTPPDISSIHKFQNKTCNKIVIQDCYGATETGATAMNPANDQSFKKGIKLFPNKKLRLVDSVTKKDIESPNKIGKILITGSGMMEGYFKNSEATAQALDADNWYDTGDVGSVDEQNYIKIIDRFKDFISVGDKQFSPTELEALIRQHPSVNDVGVVETADPENLYKGSKVVAFVIPEDLQSPEVEQNIVKFVESKAKEEMRLTGGVKFVSELPRNPLGKLLRKWLRESIWYGGKDEL